MIPIFVQMMNINEVHSTFTRVSNTLSNLEKLSACLCHEYCKKIEAPILYTSSHVTNVLKPVGLRLGTLERNIFGAPKYHMFLALGPNLGLKIGHQKQVQLRGLKM